MDGVVHHLSHAVIQLGLATGLLGNNYPLNFQCLILPSGFPEPSHGALRGAGPTAESSVSRRDAGELRDTDGTG